MFLLACTHITSNKTLLIAPACSAGEFKPVHSECFLSGCLTNLYCARSDLANKEDTIACYLFCHKKKSVNNIEFLGVG
jgi:hypothetical protein